MIQKAIKEFREDFKEHQVLYHDEVESWLSNKLEQVQKETRIRTLREAKFETAFGKEHFDEYIEFEIKNLSK